MDEPKSKEVQQMTPNRLPHDHGQETGRLLKQMPDIQRFTEGAALFRLLADGTRLRIFWLLCHTEECGINIAAAVNMSPAAVSHHLKTLRLSGLIDSRREGKEVYYKLADSQKAALAHRTVDEILRFTCPL